MCNFLEKWKLILVLWFPSVLNIDKVPILHFYYNINNFRMMVRFGSCHQYILNSQIFEAGNKAYGSYFNLLRTMRRSPTVFTINFWKSKKKKSFWNIIWFVTHEPIWLVFDMKEHDILKFSKYPPGGGHQCLSLSFGAFII